MFVDLMNDIYSTFSERFLKAQLIFEPPAPPPPPPQKATKKYNALGILEDIPMSDDGTSDGGNGADSAVDIGPAEPLTPKPVAARKDPIVVGAGRTRSLSNNPTSQNVDWSSVGRNDPCPCGSGKKFKKCHGANL